MIFKIKKILPFFIGFNVISAQFIASTPLKTLPSELNGGLNNTNISLFDKNRLDMNQNFSMSMMNFGGQSMSVASFSNNIKYKFSNNIDINANVVFMSPLGSTIPSNKLNNLNKMQIGYDAGISYKPTKNSLFQIQLSSYNSPLYPRNYFNGRIGSLSTQYHNNNIFKLD